MPKTIKPDKQAFMTMTVLSQLAMLFCLLIVFIVCANYLHLSSIYYLMAVLAFIVLSLVVYGLQLVVYNKRSYTIYDDKIVQTGGSLFTNYERELKIRNITHLKLKLPFIEHKWFATGHIKIEAAGSASAEISLSSFKTYEAIRQQVISKMKNNGFDLRQDKLITTKQPNSLAVFFDTFGTFVLGLVVAGSFINSMIYDDDGNKQEVIYEFITGHISLIVALLVLGGLVYITFYFLDLKKRVYKIYEHVITYSEGFLTKNYSLLPFENLTDSSVHQGIVDKLFNLYDIKLSCQGSSHEVLFKNIDDGQALSEELDVLIDRKKITPVIMAGDRTKQLASRPAGAVVDAATKYDTAYTAQLGMDFKRSVVVSLGLSLILLASFIVTVVI